MSFTASVIRNKLSISGAVLATVSAVLFLVVFLADLFGPAATTTATPRKTAKKIVPVAASNQVSAIPFAISELQPVVALRLL
jgi:hypothetical protein